jgi:hypothetical protein
MCFDVTRTDIYTDTGQVIGSWVVGSFCTGGGWGGYSGDSGRGGVGGNPRKSKAIPRKQLEAAINDCLQKLSPALSLSSFVPTERGRNGEITVTVGDWRFEDTSTIKVHNDVTSHSAVGLGNLRDQDRGWPLGTTNAGGVVNGYTPLGQTNGYTARDAVGSTGLADLVGPYIENQLHEFAHGLGNAIHHRGDAYDDKTTLGDAGKDFTDCVLSALKGK